MNAMLIRLTRKNGCYGMLSIKAEDLKAWRVNKLYRTTKKKAKQEWGMKCDLKSANEVVSWTRSVLFAETLQQIVLALNPLD